MNQSERVSRIPGRWRHGFQIATAIIAVIAIGVELSGLIPSVKEWLIGIWNNVSVAVSDNQNTLLNLISFVIGGIAAIVGVFFTYLKR